MHLKRLEMSGFKSFAKKTSLDFTTPVAAIVGPNGSGKSNTVEAIRFVLGEQSIKSMRGKSGTDLIFKGSKTASALNRASVSIIFDNSKRIFAFSGNDAVPLEFDEVVISREVYSDGSNKYRINGTEVRLKDVHELLASVNIGSSGHHIISQGEADRVLNASSKDRRGMIEDALGLKVYQFKIKESERKLEKTEENMKEVQSLRREIAPHITFLKKQVEKIEKAQLLRDELSLLYKKYFFVENLFIKKETTYLDEARTKAETALRDASANVEAWEAKREVKPESELRSQIKDREDILQNLRTTQDDLRRQIGRLEGAIDAEERMLKRHVANTQNQATSSNAHTQASVKQIPFHDVEHIFIDIRNALDTALLHQSHEQLIPILHNIKKTVHIFLDSHKHKITENNSELKNTQENNEEKEEILKELKTTHESLIQELRKFDHEEFTVRAEIRALEEETRHQESAWREGERVFYELKNKQTELKSELGIIVVKEESLVRIKSDFDIELKEAVMLLGAQAVRFSSLENNSENEENTFDTENISRATQEESRRKIERIKIKLEDAGAGGNEIAKEYEDATARDKFLQEQLGDLSQSIESLRTLIRELKETLDGEFKTGIEKINRQFQEFFSLMFGGGSAFLSVIVEHKRVKKGKDTEDEIDEETISSLSGELDSKLGFEEGIEINVSLPHKKVKELAMLSGGERSLTSIALLFAISQVNPPPFLVLDETDAALDEANSKKYGNMLENLSKYSQLIVVTHNRETMSRAQILYGVTVGSDGVSKLLSIKFDEAVAIAK